MFNKRQKCVKGNNMGTKMIRLPGILSERGRSRSAHYQDIQQGLFTKSVLIGRRAVGWPSNELAALNSSRIAGVTDDGIRALVIKLEAARKLVDEQNG